MNEKKLGVVEDTLYVPMLGRIYAPDPNAKVAVWHGAKEPNMKKAVQKLRRAFPALEVRPFEGFGHGEIIAHPELMAEEIKKSIGGQTDGH